VSRRASAASIAFAPLAEGDVGAVLDLWVESWSEVCTGIDFRARRDWFRDHVAAWQREGGLARVARHDGALAGLILLKVDSGHLDQVCVAVPFKGAGLAKALMAEARRLSPAGLHLDVNAINTRAIRFYEREGFVRAGEGVNPRSGLPTVRYVWRPASGG
jgi:putative acetyltransferase